MPSSRGSCSLCVLVVLVASLAYAEDVKHITSPATGRVTTITVENQKAPLASIDPVLSAEAFVIQHADAFGSADPQAEFKVKSDTTDNIGMHHVRFGQEIAGVPVYDGELVAHTNPDGTVSSLNGNVASGVKISVKPKIKEARALAIAETLFRKEYPGAQPQFRSSTLYVLQPAVFNHTNELTEYLVYEIRLLSQHRADKSYFVDAKDGTLRLAIDQVRRINRRVPDCSARLGDGGCWVNLYTLWNDPQYGWVTHPPEDYTFGYKEGEGAPFPHGPNPRYLEGGDSLDTDACFTLLGDIHSYYQSKFNRNGANGQGGNTDGSLYPQDRDFGWTYLDWVWGQGCAGCAYFANSGPEFCKDALEFDTLGHEYTHGTSQVLTYRGESGALAESHSDVIGEMFEYYESGSSDWLIGESVPRGPWRSLIDPPSLINLDSGRPYPDRYTSDDFYCGQQDNYGVHVNSTVPSKGNYLATMGGQFNGCTITGLGREKVEQILYQALFHYTPSESFAAAYQDEIQACNELAQTGSFGITPPDCQQLTRALQAAEMDQASRCESNHPPFHPATCQCVDTDGGNNGNLSGIVNYRYHNYTDQCIGVCFLQENYCQNYTRRSQIISCPRGCSNGACRTNGPLRCPGHPTPPPDWPPLPVPTPPTLFEP